MTSTAPTNHASEPTGWLAVPTPTRSDAGARIAWLTGTVGWAPPLCQTLRTLRPLGLNH